MVRQISLKLDGRQRRNTQRFKSALDSIRSGPGFVAQSVASLITDSGVVGAIPARPHTFVEIDHEIFSTVILLPLNQSYKRKFVHSELVNR